MISVSNTHPNSNSVHVRYSTRLTIRYTVQKQSQDNFDQVQKLSVVIANNSIAIDHLKITTSDLTRRMDNLESKVDSIIYTIADQADNFRDMTKLSLVANLVNRIKQSMDTGYDTLKDIIHCSLFRMYGITWYTSFALGESRIP